MPVRISNLVVIFLAAGVALVLFLFGLAYPLGMRVRGDAHVYLLIANSFDGLSAALGFLDDRTAGMPIFDYIVRRTLGLFVATDQPQPWIDVICFTLLAVHFVTSWLFAGWMKQAGFIQSSPGRQFLFFFIATFPALVGHTTTPLSDTLAIDLILCGCLLLARAVRSATWGRTLAMGMAAGLLLGFSILVRSGSLPGVFAGILATGALANSLDRRGQAALGATAIGCLLMLAPWWGNCMSAHGRLCLQYPAFEATVSAQAGLQGARTVWAKPVASPTEIPTLPDPLMMENYGSRCQLTSMGGIRSTSFTGCLLSRPLALPGFVVKKWIGLFDHLRFTPYMDKDTPTWLRRLSRGYDGLAWAGFALALATVARALLPRNQSATSRLAGAHPAIILLAVYSGVMLLVHTALHVEDRYSFPIIPLCALVLVVSAEKGLAAYRASGIRAVAVPLAFCALAVIGFFWQINAWDNILV